MLLTDGPAWCPIRANAAASPRNLPTRIDHDNRMGTEMKSPANRTSVVAPIPLEKWLSPKELAGHWGLKADSAENWIADGTVPRQMVRHCGRKRLLVHPDAIPLLQQIWNAAHE